ncbi:TPA: DUF5375 family protein [Salmonella enterica subsp. enterica serovar Neukoelln]|uniref:DUF5375 family protein n=1 Tax=Salmonella enterica TaxID=28901 RepID=UPI000FA9FBB9|nr:DNA replication protein [Salmonella enterica subsp. enterica serovar Neukoelln]EAC0953764.1 DNA replication protein [Salmonella enterica subsp. enterica]EAY1011200.1 DNA replication protein [Salmonella enterica]EBZ6303333.1 DNA replication protein [Salmonella enterica subsp. enterica serovar Gombe]ECA4032673.1 DNA replication protein [Salmonella enterica subsp. enterica serovar Odozi]EEC4857464.1 DUF5375 domain-containing protein [Salmonella enterica subsp. enterica serovar Waycross]
MKSRTLPLSLRVALYRRAVACAWLSACHQQNRHLQLTLDEIETAIARELEGFYLRQHGQTKGMEIACALLSDLMESGPLMPCPALSQLGIAVMDELCVRHIKKPVLH